MLNDIGDDIEITKLHTRNIYLEVDKEELFTS